MNDQTRFIGMLMRLSFSSLILKVQITAHENSLHLKLTIFFLSFKTGTFYNDVFS